MLVKEAQKICLHKKTEWREHWWRIGASSGYEVEVCLNCNKKVAENPPRKERMEQKRKDFKKMNPSFTDKQLHKLYSDE